MKLAAHDNSLETNAELISEDFSIGDASVVIDILRNRLYEHKIRTLVQEYMCNGRDATREVKSAKRIVVSVPNDLSPVFKVRDFGPGITPQRMVNVFIKYGASTKRKTNGQTGGFGIGAKSAWSYTDSFTIISITDGVKRTYVAHIGVNNQGRMDLLSEVNTDEETGTEIQVAVKPYDCREFQAAIMRAAFFWDDKERPEFLGLKSSEAITFHARGLMIGKELEINAGFNHDSVGMNYYDKCLLVVDGVPYPVGEKLVKKATNLESLLKRLTSKAIIHVGNGLVEVSASRETIADSDASKDALNSLALTLEASLKTYITKAFAAAKTNKDWIKTYKELSRLAHVDDYSKFNDYIINRGSVESAKFSEIDLTHYSLKSKRRSSKRTLEGEVGRFISLDNVDQVFVMDVGNEPVITRNKRIREYLESSGKMSIVVLEAKETKILDPKWIRPAPVDGQPPVAPPMIVKTSFADSAKTLVKITDDFSARCLSTLPYTPTVRTPKAKRDRTKEMFTIHQCTGHSKSPDTTTLDAIANGHGTGFVWLYVPFKDYDKFETEFNDLTLFVEGMGYRLCGLTDDSINMVAGHKQFKSYKDWKTNFKPDAKTLIEMKSQKAKNTKYMRLLKRATVTIKDKLIASMMDDYKKVVDNPIVPKTMMEWCKDELSQFVTDDENLTKLLKEKYPLVSAVEGNDYRITREQIDELVNYMNVKAKGK